MFMKIVNRLIALIFAISLVACGRQDKPIDKAVLDKILKFSASAYFDLNGNWMQPEFAQHYGMDQNFQYWARTDMPKEAIKAGITNAKVEVQYIISPEGRIEYVSTSNSKQIGRAYTDSLGYGIENKAKSFFKIGTQLLRKPAVYRSNIKPEELKPCYQLVNTTIHFGDFQLWDAVESNVKHRDIKYFGGYASFNDGTDSLDAFFDKNMIYPKSEISKNISGIVQVSFYVSPDYKLFEPKIEKGINSAFDAEAMRLLSLLAKNTEPLKFDILKDLITEKLSKDKSNNQWTKEDYFKVYTTIVFNLDKIKRTV